jgi:hypothetical protein
MSEKVIKRLLEAAANRRVYHYRDDAGNIYYSFHEAANIISPPTRLKLKNRRGEHLINFLVRLRRLSEMLANNETDAG